MKKNTILIKMEPMSITRKLVKSTVPEICTRFDLIAQVKTSANIKLQRLYHLLDK